MSGDATAGGGGAADDTVVGTFVAVVGPSGAGKDALIAAAREALGDGDRFAFPARWTTRPPDASERSVELSEAEWHRRRASGACALAWEAHGVAYAIGASVDADVAAGRIVVANVSRGVLGAALARFPRVVAFEVTASRATLAARLAARGREDAADRARRLDRAPRPMPEGLRRIEIANDGTLEAAARAFVDALRSLDELRPLDASEAPPS